jgi:hypothetical protein
MGINNFKVIIINKMNNEFNIFVTQDACRFF